MSSVPRGDGWRVNEGGRLKRICRHVPQSILGGEFLTVLVQQCGKHQLLLFVLLAVMQPSRYYRLSSLDSVLMCYNFYLIYYYVFWVEMWNLHIKCKKAECLNDRNIHSAQITNV